MPDIQSIKSVYGEIVGILEQIPITTDKFTVVFRQVGDQYNIAVDELNSVAEADYTRFKLNPSDRYSESTYNLSIVRARIGSLVKKLEEQYGLGDKPTTQQSSPVVVTVNQNQQVTVSVTPIQQLIDSTQDEDLRKDLDNLKQALENDEDPKVASSILDSIQKKSWEIFIKILPYVLEKWGHLPK